MQHPPLAPLPQENTQFPQDQSWRDWRALAIKSTQTMHPLEVEQLQQPRVVVLNPAFSSLLFLSQDKGRERELQSD